MGTSLRSYGLDLRLERAHHLLVETSMTITEIARALGYSDLFLFSRQFRQRYGQPPRALRKVVASKGDPEQWERGRG
jgi:AraC-like DNA-binding protein